MKLFIYLVLICFVVGCSQRVPKSGEVWRIYITPFDSVDLTVDSVSGKYLKYSFQRGDQLVSTSDPLSWFYGENKNYLGMDSILRPPLHFIDSGIPPWAVGKIGDTFTGKTISPTFTHAHSDSEIIRMKKMYEGQSKVHIQVFPEDSTHMIPHPFLDAPGNREGVNDTGRKIIDNTVQKIFQESKRDTIYKDTVHVKDSMYVDVVISYKYTWGEPSEVGDAWEIWKFVYYKGKLVKRIHIDTIATK